jgi:two-component system alkaline phosphatase synthesis response regulator PhoP
MADKPIKILLVDDEPDIIEFLSYGLKKEGYIIESASDGFIAIEKAKTFNPDLILLDIMMPEKDGIEVCQELRELDQFSNTIIAFLTARNESFTEISAFDNGGDDFINKPIKPNVLKSRIKGLLRRKNLLGGDKNTSGSQISIGDITIDHDRMEVIQNGNKLVLAKKEFELLSLLLSEPGKVFKRADIMSRVWGDTVIVGDRTIDVHIRKLREKLGNSYIQTYKGVGYKFNH